jgi:hypothetical protein
MSTYRPSLLRTISRRRTPGCVLTKSRSKVSEALSRSVSVFPAASLKGANTVMAVVI